MIYFKFVDISKLVTWAVLKAAVFWKKVYNVIAAIFVTTNKISPHASSFIIDWAMWLQFGNYRNYLKEVIATPVLRAFYHKNTFPGLAIGRVYQFRLKQQKGAAI